LLTILIACAGALKVEPHPPGTPDADLDLLKELHDTVTKIQDGIYNFWITYGPDEEYGAFYNTVDKSGDPVLDSV